MIYKHLLCSALFSPKHRVRCPTSQTTTGMRRDYSLKAADHRRPRPRERVGSDLCRRRQTHPGGASWYGPGFHGKRTASGERFNTRALTAAHKSLPFGSRVLVTNERTGKSVVVRINDRGPYAHGRVIDLSKAAAQAVGISGVGKVKLTRL